MEVVNKYGSDALRIYLLSSPVVRGLDLRFSERDVEDAVRRYLLPFWNVFHFFTSYAALAKGYEPKRIERATELADRHILAELEELRKNVEANIEAYDLPRCYQAIQRFIDTLSGWYVRLNRPRFWTDTVTDDARQAFDTLYTALLEASRIFAPFIPFAMDHIHKHLAGDSVHLADWPVAVPGREDVKLTAEIDTVRRVIECGAQRARKGAHQLAPAPLLHPGGWRGEVAGRALQGPHRRAGERQIRPVSGRSGSLRQPRRAAGRQETRAASEGSLRPHPGRR